MLNCQFPNTPFWNVVSLLIICDLIKKMYCGVHTFWPRAISKKRWCWCQFSVGVRCISLNWVRCMDDAFPWIGWKAPHRPTSLFKSANQPLRGKPNGILESRPIFVFHSLHALLWRTFEFLKLNIFKTSHWFSVSELKNWSCLGLVIKVWRFNWQSFRIDQVRAWWC